jgi:hypothetical protein
MTCREFQQVLPGVLEGSRSAEQTAHLRLCSECSDLVADLNSIARQAKLLQAADEPSPRVWNSLEIALRQEGLIRQTERKPELVPSRSRSWRTGWLLVPAAVALLVGVVIYQREHVSKPIAAHQATSVPNAPVVVARAPDSDDDQLLQVVSTRSPSMRATYQASLQDVNAYIRDAEEVAQRNPGDEEAQRSLMDAYEQRSVVYEMALDRSLP